MTPIPVVFIHYGEGSHLPHVLKQANRWSKNVHLLGDASNSLKTGSLENLQTDIPKFISTYEHLSTNGQNVELFCMTRWLALRNFMRAGGFKVCLYLDSDVLLFSDPDEEWPRFKQFEFTLTHWTSGHSSFWTLDGLEKFCDFMLNLYRDKSGYEWEKISSHYHIRRKHGLDGGVCDMTLLEYYGRQHVGQVGEMMHIQVVDYGDLRTYDHIISAPDQGFLMERGHKKVILVEGRPYVPLEDNRHHLVQGIGVRFNTLHFQGQFKSLIAGTVAESERPNV